MRLINNTIRWARKANATTSTFHMVADQTDVGRGPRAACNRSWGLDLSAGGPGYTGQTAAQVGRSTYGMFCDRCQTKAEALTARDQMARDRDHAQAIEIVAADVAARTSAETPAGTVVVEILTKDSAWAAEYGQHVDTTDVGGFVRCLAQFPTTHVRLDAIMGRPIVRIMWPSQVPADAADAAWSTFVPMSRVVLSCINPTHDHVTTVDDQGDPCPTRAMICNHCGAPAMYDTTADDYRHAPGMDTDPCFLIPDLPSVSHLPETPCVPATLRTI